MEKHVLLSLGSVIICRWRVPIPADRRDVPARPWFCAQDKGSNPAQISPRADYALAQSLFARQGFESRANFSHVPGSPAFDGSNPEMEGWLSHTFLLRYLGHGLCLGVRALSNVSSLRTEIELQGHPPHLSLVTALSFPRSIRTLGIIRKKINRCLSLFPMTLFLVPSTDKAIWEPRPDLPTYPKAFTLEGK